MADRSSAYPSQGDTVCAPDEIASSAPVRRNPYDFQFESSSATASAVRIDTFGARRYFPFTTPSSNSASASPSPNKTMRRGSGLVAAAAAAAEGRAWPPLAPSEAPAGMLVQPTANVSSDSSSSTAEIASRNAAAIACGASNIGVSLRQHADEQQAQDVAADRAALPSSVRAASVGSTELPETIVLRHNETEAAAPVEECSYRSKSTNGSLFSENTSASHAASHSIDSNDGSSAGDHLAHSLRVASVTSSGSFVHSEQEITSVPSLESGEQPAASEWPPAAADGGSGSSDSRGNIRSREKLPAPNPGSQAVVRAAPSSITMEDLAAKSADDDLEKSSEETAEEEPRLKYQRLGCDLTDVLAAGAATCLAVSDKILALATTAGSIHLLDYEGNQVRVIAAHAAPIHDMAFDLRADHLASCADDGSTLVTGMYSEEAASFKHGYPVRCIALDPRYGQRKTREFVSGGDSGEVVLHSRGWLGLRDTVLHRGGGVVQAIQWNTSLIAWANCTSVKVYDTSAHQRIFSIAKPANAAAMPHAKPHLYWESDSLLYVGWASTVTVARVMLLEETSTVGSVQSHVMQILVSLDLQACILGVAPFGQDVALLAQRIDAETPQSTEQTTEDLAAMPPGHEMFPELKILSWRGDEVASDVLPIMGAEGGAGGNLGMSLACYYPLSKERTLQADRRLTAPKKVDYKWWPDGSEPLYYVVTPRDVVVGRPRDGDDRVSWLLQRRRFPEALKIASSDCSVRKHSRALVAAQYLAHLVALRDFEAAARLCPELLQSDVAAWERQIYTFAQHRKLPLLASFIPTSKPQLRQQAYEMVLMSFLVAPAHHAELLLLLKRWPPVIYSVARLTDATLQRLQALGGKSSDLMAAAAQLYTLQGRADLALAILMRLGHPDVLPFITEHSLFQVAGLHAVTLMQIDAAGATELLVRRCDDIPPPRVVSSLQAVIQSARDGGREAEVATWRRRLYHYLDTLYCSDPGAAAEFADMQVQLYAEFQPEALLQFLISGQGYSLEPALSVCEERGLVAEQVHVLGRMGASSKALDIIVGSQRDVPAAISFLQASNAADDELWQHLIAVALQDAGSTAQLLDSIGSHVSPLALVQQIPSGMAIPGLRDHLVRIISEYRTQTSLAEGCHVILHHDCVTLAQRVYREVRRAMRSCYVRLPAPAGVATSPSGSTSLSAAGIAAAPEWQLQSGALAERTLVRDADLPPSLTSRPLPQPTASHCGGEAPPKVWIGLHASGREDAMAGAMKRWRSEASPLDLAKELPSLITNS